jgi:DNA-binding NarL/FixJ family response regulator
MLTLIEFKIILLVKQAKCNKYIAKELGIAEGTVRNYMHNIFIKLKVKSRAELIIKEL